MERRWRAGRQALQGSGGRSRQQATRRRQDRLQIMEGSARYPGRAPIDAYGNGGFRFAGMSHRGSILCLPSGIHAWEVAGSAELSVAHIAPILAERSKVEFILLGTGRT